MTFDAALSLAVTGTSPYVVEQRDPAVELAAIGSRHRIRHIKLVGSTACRRANNLVRSRSIPRRERTWKVSLESQASASRAAAVHSASS